MPEFIKKLNETADLNLVEGSIEKILKIRAWPNGSKQDSFVQNQIGLNYRNNAIDQWLDAAGGYNDNQEGKNEIDFVNWNSQVNNYLVNLIEKVVIKNNFRLGRVRIMRLLPKTGLTYHYDTEKRIHLVIKTNPGAFIFTSAPNELEYGTVGYHLPLDGNFYLVDTTLPHFVYNSGTTERIHLVINCLER